MVSLPYALALSDPRGSGRLDYIATFAEVADLWTFWDAWRHECTSAPRFARFVHIGRAVRTAIPPGNRTDALLWAQGVRAA